MLVVVLFAETFNFRTRPHVPLNTAFWPRVILIGLAVVSVILVVRGRLGLEEHEPFARRALVVFLGAAAFAVSLIYFGFLVSSGIVVALGYIWLSEDRRPTTFAAGTAFGLISALGVFALFKFALKVQLPEGALF